LRRGSRLGVSGGFVGGRAARRAVLGQGGELLQRLRCGAVRVGVVDDQGLSVGAGDLEVLAMELEFADPVVVHVSHPAADSGADVVLGPEGSEVIASY
jgi:hypothetical protein